MLAMEHRPATLLSGIQSSQFHVRASKFLQKLSSFPRRRTKSQSRDLYEFDAQHTHSYDGSTKPYMSQPALVFQTSDSPRDIEGSSRSGTPSPPSHASRLYPMTSFPGVIDLGSRDDLPISPDSFFVSSRGASASPAPNPASALRSRTLQVPDPRSGRSVSFDIPREPASTTSTEEDNVSDPAPIKRSFEFKRAIFSRRADRKEASSSSHSLLSTSRLWGRSTTKLPPITQVNEHSPAVQPSRAPRIEGLPPSDFNAFNPRFLQQTGGSRENDERPIEPPGGNRPTPNLTLRIPSETSHVSSHSPSMPPTPPTYAQVGNSPRGQTDASSQAQAHRKSISSRLSSLPPSVFQISAESGSAHLSPSVISRHPPLPLTILPRLHIVETHGPASSSKIRVGLRSVPALTRQGLDAREPDHEIGTDDEDDLLEVDQEPLTTHQEIQDSEDEDDITTEGSLSRANRYSNSSLITTDNDPRPTQMTRPKPDFLSPESSQSQQSSSQNTPVDWETRLTAFMSASTSLRPDLAMHRRASRSTGDLLVGTKKRDIPQEQKNKGKAKDTAPDNPLGRETTVVGPESHLSLLRRQRSLPMFTESSEPPPYPAFGKIRQTFRIQPREEEGKERLPPYTNAIYLSALLPRKVEFSAPGVQSKDRKWRRSLCVLEGTAFKIFRPPHGAAGVSALGQWWERRVGVGDVSTTTSPSSFAPKPPHRRRKDEDLPEDLSPTSATVSQESPIPPVTKKKRQIAPGFLSRSNVAIVTSPRRQSLDSPRSERGPPRIRRSLSISRPSLQTIAHSSSTSVTSTPGSWMTHGTPISRVAESSGSGLPSPGPDRLEPNPKDLIRVYTLQRAESGLANDYTKRKHVIRVRMEGEQFLLQAPDINTVVEWVEGFQAASGIALDLEDRPMPKGPVFPRRRRRRIRPVEVPVIVGPPS